MSAPEGKPPVLGSEHYRAICDEIGARLAFALRPATSDLPPRIVGLLNRLALLDHDAPSIAPSLERRANAEEATLSGCTSADQGRTGRFEPRPSKVQLGGVEP
jgi:hypothetical protein